MRFRIPARIVVALGMICIVVMAACSPLGNRDALRKLVQDQCLVDWQNHHDPSPCKKVYVPENHRSQEGYAVLADRKGGAHFLLIPIRTVTGIEDPILLANDSPNYFAAAWQARDQIVLTNHQGLAREDVGLAVNPTYARSQDQLHIHIECIQPGVQVVLMQHAAEMSTQWLPTVINGNQYYALRITGEELNGFNPFQWLAAHPPAAHGGMDTYTLVLTGIRIDNDLGFILVAGHNTPGGETLLDPECKVASKGSQS